MNKARKIFVQKILVCAAGLIILVGIAWRLAHGQVQNQSNWIPAGIVQQSGTITAGHDVMWTSSNTIQDAGFAPMQLSGAFTNGHMVEFNSLGQLIDAGTAPITSTGGITPGHGVSWNAAGVIQDIGFVPITPFPACQVTSLGGGLIGLLGIATGTCTATGAIVGKPCQSNANDGSLPASIKVDCAVTSTNTVTVQLTGLAAVGITPPVKNYNVVVIQ